MKRIFMRYDFPILVKTVSRVALLSLVFLAVSCETKDYGEIRLSRQQVTADAGSMFVTVESGQDWTLSVVYHGSSSDWIEIDPLSGSGNKSNIVLKYSENDTAEQRDAEIVGVFGKYSCKAALSQAGQAPEEPENCHEVPV